MAKPTKKSTTSTKVTRIKATDSAGKSAKAATKPIKSQKNLKSARTTKADKALAAEKAAAKKAKREQSRNPFIRLAEYTKGAWYELRQVRWPDRAETWKMTGALLVFCAFFVGLILLLDILFKYLFELIIG